MCIIHLLLINMEGVKDEQLHSLRPQEKEYEREIRAAYKDHP
jgi:hypothetical protein